MNNFCLLLGLGLSSLAMAQSPLKYPDASADKAVANGDRWYNWADGFRWLEDETQERTQTWIEAQKELYASYMANRTQVLAWKQRLKIYYDYPKWGSPVLAGPYRFETFNPGLRNQAWLLRYTEGAETPDTLVDPLQWAADGSQSMAAWAPDSSGRWLAVAISDAGSDWRTIRIMDLSTLQWLDEEISQVKFSGVSWAGKGFFYSKFPQQSKDLTSQNQGQQLRYHAIGTEVEKDPIVFEWPQNPRYGVYGYTTPDQQWLIVSISPGTYGNMLKAVRLKDGIPVSDSFSILTREFDSESSVVWHHNDRLYLYTNHEAPNRKLVRLKPGDQSRQWETIIPEHPEKVLQNVKPWKKGWLVLYTHKVSSELWYFRDGADPMPIELPYKGSISGLSVKENHSTAYFTLTTYAMPPTVFALNFGQRVPVAMHGSQKPGIGKDIEIRQEWMNASDGERVPMYIVQRKNRKAGPGPCLLYGYGGFNISILPFYQPWFHAFVEAGGTLVVPALRGGAEFGEAWHQAGMKDRKERVFLDMEEAAEFLIEKNITRPEWLAVHGRSNGGLLVGAVLTRRPDLFAVALPSVGVLDMMRFHKFTIGHAWRSEYGDPDDSLDAVSILRYSPLHNLNFNTHYPATLVLTADHDDRVVPSHSYKFTAAMQQAASDHKPVLIRIDTSVGHGAGKSIDAQMNEFAEVLSFMELWMNPWP